MSRLLMVGAGVDSEVPQHLSSQVGVGKHPPHRLSDDFFGFFFEKRVQGLGTLAGGVTGIPVVKFLFTFFTGKMNLTGIHDDHLVSTVQKRGIFRLVLSHKDGRHTGSEAAQDFPAGVHQIGLSLNVLFFQKEGAHKGPKLYQNSRRIATFAEFFAEF